MERGRGRQEGLGGKWAARSVSADVVEVLNMGVIHVKHGFQIHIGLELVLLANIMAMHLACP